MAWRVVYCCPQCGRDIGSRLRLITTPSVPCPRCGFSVRVTAAAVIFNWEWNFLIGSGLMIWLAFAAAIFASPEFAAKFGKSFQLPAESLKDQFALAGLTLIPTILLIIPCTVLGKFLGERMAARLDPSASPPALQLPTGLRPSSAAPAPHIQLWTQEPKTESTERGGLVRGLFCVLWPVGFFIAAALIANALSGGMSGDDAQLRKKAGEQAAKQFGPLIYGGTFILALLAYFGVLPGTNKTKR